MGMFTATKLQVATYLLGVCPFSIAFLVFLNSSVSFVITDLLGNENGVGDAVGTLGFADELVALVACPLWGLLSDHIGVRSVCSIGYLLVGISLFVFVQAQNVYPQLLLARLFFSVGGSAASTMVTAVLPTMSYSPNLKFDKHQHTTSSTSPRHAQSPSLASERTITPSSYLGRIRNLKGFGDQSRRDPTSKIAGFVGMATGCGALIALSVFLPLPARFQRLGASPASALQYSYYIVGLIALLLSGACLLGLRNLKSEAEKNSVTPLSAGDTTVERGSLSWQKSRASFNFLLEALLAGVRRKDILVGYVGGFVARASSVAISLFIPLLVNASFLSSGLCDPSAEPGDPSGLPDIKRRCPRAYIVAAELTGVSQLVALLTAPLFGYISSRLTNKTIPLMFACVCAIVGYPLLALRFNPDDSDVGARVAAFLAVCLIGIGQIGAIVCSLALLSCGVLDTTGTPRSSTEHPPTLGEVSEQQTATQPLLERNNELEPKAPALTDLKGSVAGIYSFYGGAGILLLTKLGGALFDSTTSSAPFYMMTVFNGILLVTTLVVSSIGDFKGKN